MAEIILGVGDLAASNSSGTVLKTFALGSCVAVILMDATTRTIGMAHVALPESSINREKSERLPGYFADSGIQELVNQMKLNGVSNLGKIVVKLAGGAQIMDPNNTFNIGRRNALAVKQHLAEYGLGLLVEDLGDNYSRTVTAYIDSGVIQLSSPGRPDWYL